MHFNRSRLASAAAVIATVATITWMGVAPSFAAETHVIKIETSGDFLGRWSANGLLFDGAGNLVYEWNESNNADGYVRWEFVDGGDNGHLAFTVTVGDRQQSFGGALSNNYCVRISMEGGSALIPSGTPTIQYAIPCPFEGRGMG